MRYHLRSGLVHRERPGQVVHTAAEDDPDQLQQGCPDRMEEPAHVADYGEPFLRFLLELRTVRSGLACDEQVLLGIVSLIRLFDVSANALVRKTYTGAIE